MKKRMLSLVTVILLLVSLIPTEVLAAKGAGKYPTEIGTPTESENQDDGTIYYETDAAVYINPIYKDVIGEDDIDVPDEIESSGKSSNYGISAFAEDSESIEYCDTIEEAGAILRAGMVAREETITVYYYGDVYSSEYFKDLCTNQIIPEALAETENANEGDYLRYNYGGTGYRASIAADSDGNYKYYTIAFTPTYFTTAEQETAVNEKVDSLLETTFSFEDSTSDYKEIYEVYDYICSNVTYDNENLEDSSYTLKYSTYAALINGTAVCQGYASLYYRILRELNLDIRVATGYGGEASEDVSNYYENHAWNIVQIDGKWYFADSTWDAGFSDEVAAGTYSYQYLLKGTSDFDSLEAPYSTTGIHYLIMDEDFVDAYSIEEMRYIAENASECTHEYGAVVTIPTCTAGGYTTYICSLCGDTYISEETEALGHSWDNGTVTKEATTEEEGIKTYNCTVCGVTKTETIPVKSLSAPSVKLSVSQNNGKIRLTGNVKDYENIDDYYEITGHGFVYVTKALLGSKILTVNTIGRTKVNISGIGSTGSYSYSMTPKTASTIYATRAFVTYKNSAGKTIYVYSDTVYTSYSGIK